MLLDVNIIKRKQLTADEDKKRKEIKEHSMALQMRDKAKIERWSKFRVNQNWEHLMNAGVFKLGFPVRLGNAQGNYEGLVDCFKDQTVYIIGGGISGRGFDFNKLDKCHTITVNHMIEYYDKSEIHYWMDQRFLRITKYNFEEYQGVCVFANNNNWVPKSGKYYMTRYRSNTEKHIDLDIEKGLYGRILSGISVVHLALITGAKRVYLIGVDHHNGDLADGLHYAPDYTGEDRSTKSQRGYAEKMRYIDRFLPWKDKIIQVQGQYPGQFYGAMFDTVSMDEMPIIEERIN